MNGACVWVLVPSFVGAKSPMVDGTKRLLFTEGAVELCPNTDFDLGELLAPPPKLFGKELMFSVLLLLPNAFDGVNGVV